MSKRPDEISDNEIRIISADRPEIQKDKKMSGIWPAILLVIIVAGTIGVILFHNGASTEEMPEYGEEYTPEEMPQPLIVKEEPITEVPGFTIAIDTVLDKKGLLILLPETARPRLIIGNEALNDSNIILATQAADVRGDNGEIAGTFVMDGEVISKGEAKAGFCSIVNGTITIGVADATYMLEKTLSDGGYFFRQFPLVAGGLIVENKPKGRALRKALAEIGGKTCVVMSKERLTFHDFSQLLIDAGARNAIYLVGSTSYGFYVNAEGEKILTGRETPPQEYEYVNYIIWERL